MKVRGLLVSVISVMACVYSIGVGASSGDCAKETSAQVSQACRSELVRLMEQDKTSQALRNALEVTVALKNCSSLGEPGYVINYTFEEATGPILEFSNFISCESDDADGYWLVGEYLIDGVSSGAYRFKSITLTPKAE